MLQIYFLNYKAVVFFFVFFYFLSLLTGTGAEKSKLHKCTEAVSVLSYSDGVCVALGGASTHMNVNCSH